MDADDFYLLVAPQSWLSRFTRRHPWLVPCHFIGVIAFFTVAYLAPAIRHDRIASLACALVYVLWGLTAADLYAQTN